MGADSSGQPPKIQYQPWRCLWRGSLQITRTEPLRRMTLQFLHIFLTEALTFIVLPLPRD